MTARFNPVNKTLVGAQPIQNHWMSFQCIYIPNKYMGEFVNWYDKHVINNDRYAAQREGGADDDYLFFEYLKNTHTKIKSVNLSPCLVDHVDYLIGGSVLFDRKHKINRALYFDDYDLVNELTEKLNNKL